MADFKKVQLQLKIADEIAKIAPVSTSGAIIVGPNGETLKQRLAAIAKQLGSTDLSVTEQVNEVKDQIKEIIGTAPERLDSVHEIASWIEAHEEDFDALKTVADGMEAAVAEVIGDLGEYATVTDYVEAKMEAAAAAEKVRCEAAIALEKARAEAAEQALGELIADNTAAIEAEVERATTEEARLEEKMDKIFTVFESVDAFDPEKMGENGLACIILPDDPVEVADEAGLMEAVAGENPEIVLTSDIVVTQNIDLSGKNIIADGYVIEAASQDVVITL